MPKRSNTLTKKFKEGFECKKNGKDFNNIKKKLEKFRLNFSKLRRAVL